MQENADTAALVDVAESTTRLPVEGTTTADALNSTTSLLTDHDDTSSVSDSAFASSTGSSIRSASLTSSVYDYEFKHGRRYHSNKSSAYSLPNDENEQDRLDLQHEIFRFAANGALYMAPLPHERLHKVLDVGCGTGLWCIDLADQVPNATVEGFDISPIQPGWVPPNTQFYVDDCNTDWQDKAKYDLVHTRALTLAVKEWSRFFRQAYDALLPGGYIECQEYLVPFNCKNPGSDFQPGFVQWSEYLREGVAKMGYDLAATANFESMLKEAGFEDVTVKYQDWPVGTWAKGENNKRLGTMTAENFKDGIRNSVKMFNGLLKWSEEEFQVFAAKAANEIDSAEKHLWARVAFVYGRKPG